MAKTYDAAAIAADWASRMGASRDKISRGIDATTTAPGASAARQADVWANNTVASKAKFQRNVGRVSLADWQNAFKAKGLDRIATGATAAQPKMQAFLTNFLPAVSSMVAALPARGGYDANKARMNAMVDKLHAYGQRSS